VSPARQPTARVICDPAVVDESTAGAVAWLLATEEPAVRHLTRRDLLDEDSVPDRAAITAGPWVSALLAGQQEDGGFGGDPYRKWTGAHWRLVALAELAVPASDPRVAAAAEHVLAWIVRSLRYPPRVVDGLPRSHASIHGLQPRNRLVPQQDCEVASSPVASQHRAACHTSRLTTVEMASPATSWA
jgi:hypothetical protein